MMKRSRSKNIALLVWVMAISAMILAGSVAQHHHHAPDGAMCLCLDPCASHHCSHDDDNSPYAHHHHDDEDDSECSIRIDDVTIDDQRQTLATYEHHGDQHQAFVVLPEQIRIASYDELNAPPGIMRHVAEPSPTKVHIRGLRAPPVMV